MNTTKRSRALALSILALVVSARPADAAEARGKLVVTFFDMSGGLSIPSRTGHLGTAIAVQTPSGATYLCDTGQKVPPVEKDAEVSEFDTGRDCIAPFLSAKGIRVIDGIIVSHGHGDHYGGAGYLLDHFTVKQIIHPVLTFPEELYQPDKPPKNRPWIESVRRAEALVARAKQKGIEDRVVTAGNKLLWDEAIEVEVLSPPQPFLTSKVSVENANSLVVRLRHGKIVFLFTADILPETQEHLMKAFPAGKLKANVMSAPHHGTDSYEPFAKVARPDVVVVSCGTRGAPERVKKTEEAFGAIGSKIYVTSWHGTVQIVSDGDKYKVETERTPPPRP
jgi:beta-lactamase superfamily II metal-dependent hydrolase